MGFGVYVHIPYCLQRCVYCDFATFEVGLASRVLPPEIYIERVKKEIIMKGPAVGPRNRVDTVYFGGGTPSLLEPHLLADVLATLKDQGFAAGEASEITLEINPATLDGKKLENLLKAGFNRFSVGAQSFNDELLKLAHRKHSAQDTRDTLSLLVKNGVNFSLDILFALPGQTTDDLSRDLDEAMQFGAPHVSPYCLTVPESNPLYKGRPLDDTQVAMFDLIESRLTQAGLLRYEISNFAKPGFESRHNFLYWNDDEYWGVGLSSHSYLHVSRWGTRFWNTRSLEKYDEHVRSLQPGSWSPLGLPEESGEVLLPHQALTDFIHTALRKATGLSRSGFQQKFGFRLEQALGASFPKLLKHGLIRDEEDRIVLTRQGVLLSNKVFQELTFLPDDMMSRGIDKEALQNHILTV
jgi:oxygen-independent coproporphyrinogen III oxidase